MSTRPDGTSDEAMVANLLDALRRHIESERQRPEAAPHPMTSFVIDLPSPTGPPWDTETYRVLATMMSSAERMLVTTEDLDSSVLNGGFEGYFDNPNGMCGELAIEGLRLIGDEERAGIMGAAIDRLVTLLRWPQPLHEFANGGRDIVVPQFRDLEDAWYKLARQRPFQPVREVWVVAHRNEFRDLLDGTVW